MWVMLFLFFKQKTAYEMRISDWSSDVCSSDLKEGGMKVQKHTVQWRLMLWGQWVQEPRTELAQSFSPFGKFAEMQENSNARADGIIYEIIDGDRKSVV